MMEVGKAMTSIVNCMNTFRMCQPHIKQQKMMSIMDKQMQYMMSMCKNIGKYMQSKGGNVEMPQQMMSWQSEYEFGNSMQQQRLQMDAGQLDEFHTGCCMMSALKSCSIACNVATMACTDPIIRNIVMGCCTSCMNMAYDIFMYMNKKEMFQLSNMQGITNEYMMNIYQPMNEMQYQ